jgi:anti-sigma-K factor RskA
MNYDHPPLLEKLAGAYVLGTMGAHASPRFARYLATSPGAQRAVACWQNVLAPFDTPVAPLAPPAALWVAIATETGHAASVADSAPCGRAWRRARAHNLAPRPAPTRKAGQCPLRLGVVLNRILVASGARRLPLS